MTALHSSHVAQLRELVTRRCINLQGSTTVFDPARSGIVQGLSSLSGMELESAERRVKQRTLGNIRLIAELFNKEVRVIDCLAVCTDAPSLAAHGHKATANSYFEGFNHTAACAPCACTTVAIYHDHWSVHALQVVREPIVHACIGELLGDSARIEPVEDNIEVGCLRMALC